MMSYYEDYEIRLGGLPPREELAENILAEAAWLRDNFARADLIDPDDPGMDENPEEANAGTDCRVQLVGGNWYWHTGDPSYDRDHRGYWGHGWIPYDLTDHDEALSIADDIISELQEYAGQSGAFCRLILGYEYVNKPDADPAYYVTDRIVHHIPEFNGGLDDIAYTAACGCVVDGVEEAPEDATVAAHVTCPACLAVWEENRRKYNIKLARREYEAAPDSAKPLFYNILRDLDRIDEGVPIPDLTGYIQRLVDLRLCYRFRPRKALDLTKVVNSLIEGGSVLPRYGAALGGALGIPPHGYTG